MANTFCLDTVSVSSWLRFCIFGQKNFSSHKKQSFTSLSIAQHKMSRQQVLPTFLAPLFALIALVAVGKSIAAEPEVGSLHEARKLVDKLVEQVGDLDAFGGQTEEDKISGRFLRVALAIGKLSQSEATSSKSKTVEIYSQLGRPLFEACQLVRKESAAGKLLKRQAKQHLAVEVCSYVPNGFGADESINSFVQLSLVEDSSLLLEVSKKLLVETKKLAMPNADSAAHLNDEESLDEQEILELEQICVAQGKARRGLIWMAEAGYPFFDKNFAENLVSTEKACKVLVENKVFSNKQFHSQSNNETERKAPDKKRSKTAVLLRELKKRLNCGENQVK